MGRFGRRSYFATISLLRSPGQIQHSSNGVAARPEAAFAVCAKFQMGRVLCPSVSNREFRLEQPGAYVIRQYVPLLLFVMRILFNSPPTAEFDLSDNPSVAVQPGSEEQLKAVFNPFVTNLDSSDLTQRSEAATAIITLAPPSSEMF